MSCSQNTNNKASNNVYRLFIVLMVLIVVTVFIQSIYIHRLMKQIRYLSEKQAHLELLEKEKTSVMVIKQ